MSGRLTAHLGCRKLKLHYACSWRRQMLLCTRNVVSAPRAYVQGQSPEPRVREYFYYLDHQGQLFLDDTKVKNFITCFKDEQFLAFFFTRVRVNHLGRYEQLFPFVSLCGRERNFLRCDDQPIVFTHLLPSATPAAPPLLSYCGGGAKLAVSFRPEALYMRPKTGRLYHPAPDRTGGVGLMRSALAYDLSANFSYLGKTPTHFLWEGLRHQLTNELAEHFNSDKAVEGEGD